MSFFLKASELDFNRIYGFGNETPRDKNLANEGFYKTNQQDYSIESKISVNVSRPFKLIFGASYKCSNVKLNRMSNVNFLRPYGSGKLSTLGIKTGFDFDNRNNLVFPERGAKAVFEASFFPKIFNSESTFGKIRGDIVTYHSLKTFTDITLVVRAGGEVLVDDYPFYLGAALGGLKNLRGFSRERFLGDAMVFGQSELRIYLASLNLFFPSKIGMSVMGDAGRVFFKR